MHELLNYFNKLSFWVVLLLKVIIYLKVIYVVGGCVFLSRNTVALFALWVQPWLTRETIFVLQCVYGGIQSSVPVYICYCNNLVIGYAILLTLQLCCWAKAVVIIVAVVADKSLEENFEFKKVFVYKN